MLLLLLLDGSKDCHTVINSGIIGNFIIKILIETILNWLLTEFGIANKNETRNVKVGNFDIHRDSYAALCKPSLVTG